MLKIGIVGQDQPDSKFGVNENYLEWITYFGHPVIITPISADDYIDLYDIDALVLPGGADVNPSRYTSNLGYKNGNPNVFLEYFDTQILPRCIGLYPIFGICRGLQTLNVHFGGTLHQHLYGHKYSISETDEAHKVILNNDKNKKMGVNSFHHQGIDRLADGFTALAVSDDHNKVIEAIINEELSIAAVQWHPERLDDKYSVDLFNRIIDGDAELRNVD